MANTLKKTTFRLHGLSCAACVNRVEKAIHPLPGINSFSVHLLKETLTVSFDPNKTDESSIIQAIEKAGYRAFLNEPLSTVKKQNTYADITFNNAEPHFLFYRFVASLILSVPILLLSFSSSLKTAFESTLSSSNTVFGVVLILTGIVIAINYRFFIQGFQALIHFSPSMDTLISTSVLATLVSGLLSFTFNQHTMDYCFESIVMILTLFTFGRWIENRAKKNSLSTIARLIQLKPQQAHRLQNNILETIATEDIRPGDILLVKEGETIGADGIVIDGYGYVNESMMTGENQPVEKLIGDVVLGATINQSGTLTIRATRVNANSTLSSIIRLIDEVTSSKAPIERLADKISRIFVPCIFLISTITFLVWIYLDYTWSFAFTQAINVLVISCPCALALATPVAIMVGTGQSSALGILIKSAQCIEMAGKIDTIVFDKTGTLTQGKPQLTTIINAPSCTEEELLTIAASLEYASSHPLAQAILSHPKISPLTRKTVEQFQTIPGLGLTGVIDNNTVAIGNIKILDNLEIRKDCPILKQANHLANQGQSILFVRKNNDLIGFLSLTDTIKTEAKDTIEQLAQLHMHIIMLTGDATTSARSIANQLHIHQYEANLLPQDKQQYIHELQKRGHRVMMIGDGINDAPSLAQADIGVAMGAGTDIAISSADMVLMRSSLLAVYQCVTFSRSILRIIKQNLFWAFFYNLLAIPIATGIFYPYISLTPMIGALAMCLSSMTIFLNTFRLKYLLKPNMTNNKEQTMKKTIMIEGMNCMHCVACVEKALKAIPGTTDISIDLQQKQAVLNTSSTILDAQLKNAIENAGFKVTNIQ